MNRSSWQPLIVIVSNDSSSALSHPHASLCCLKNGTPAFKNSYFSHFPVLLKTYLLQVNAKQRAERFGEATICVTVLRAVTFFQTFSFPGALVSCKKMCHASLAARV